MSLHIFNFFFAIVHAGSTVIIVVRKNMELFMRENNYSYWNPNFFFELLFHEAGISGSLKRVISLISRNCSLIISFKRIKCILTFCNFIFHGKQKQFGCPIFSGFYSFFPLKLNLFGMKGGRGVPNLL